MATHLITGAGSGIGEAVADRLHARGDELVLLARNDERAADLRSRYPGSPTIVCDLVAPKLVADTAEPLPQRLDSVVMSAGVVDLAPVAELELASLCAQLNVNLVSPMVLTGLLLPAVRRAQGLFVYVNSSAGLSAGADWSAYAASKFGLRGFADSLRAEEINHGVRVTTVFPSRTATPMQAKVHEQEGRTYDPAHWISAGTVADTILHVIDLPGDATIPEVTVRPVVPRAI